ncbi:MAG: hypothetical protein QM804_17845 [Propionicimonas sp.]
MTRRILILAAGVGSGHNQAAGAIEAALAGVPEVGEVRRLDILETTSAVFNRLYDDAYFALVAEVPWLVGWGYDQQDPPFRLTPLVQWWDQLNTLPLVREVRDYDPDLVICTHFLPARMVSLMLARRQLQATLTVVATDYDFQGLWLTSPFSHFFVAREETRTHMARIGVPGDRVSVSGIPVRPDLAEPVDDATPSGGASVCGPTFRSSWSPPAPPAAATPCRWCARYCAASSPSRPWWCAAATTS